MGVAYDSDPEAYPTQRSGWTESLLGVPSGAQAPVGLPPGERVSVGQAEGSCSHHSHLSEGGSVSS